MKPFAISRALPLALALSAAGLVSACGSLDFANPFNPAPGAQQSKPAQEGATPAEKIVKLPLSSAELDCPPVEIDEGGASARVGGPDNPSVRYQFAISETARECDPVTDKQFNLKVGVSGRLIIGPAGKPGAYSAPLRVTVRDELNKKDAFTKVYKVEASVPDNGDAPFKLVTEPIALPMDGFDLSNQYILTVGFDNGKTAAESKAKSPKTPKAAKPRKPQPAKTAAPD